MLITIVLALALAGGLIYRARWLRVSSSSARLTDEMIRQIEQSGCVDVDEPLDLDEIRDEEMRFWEEQPWEEPEEF